MVTLIHQRLLNELLQTLHVLLINDLSQHSQSICTHDLILGLLDVFREAGNHDEHLIFSHVQLLYEDVDQASQVLVHVGRHLEKFCDVEEH